MLYYADNDDKHIDRYSYYYIVFYDYCNDEKQ